MSDVDASASTASRWPRAGLPQRPLAAAAAVALVAAFMPWVSTRVGSFSGLAGPGIWTFYAASLGVGGALVGSRRGAALLAAVFAAAAIGLPAWQAARLLERGLGLGGDGWVPGMGMVLTVAAGVVALRAALALSRSPGEAAGGVGFRGRDGARAEHPASRGHRHGR